MHKLMQTARQMIKIVKVLTDSVAKTLFNSSYRRRKSDEGKLNGIITGTKPRFHPKYDPNSAKDKLGESGPGVYTKIGPLAIREGRVRILQTIIHEEVHHWIHEQGFSQYNEELAELLAGHYAGAILDGWDGIKT